MQTGPRGLQMTDDTEDSRVSSGEISMHAGDTNLTYGRPLDMRTIGTCMAMQRPMSGDEGDAES